MFRLRLLSSAGALRLQKRIFFRFLVVVFFWGGIADSATQVEESWRRDDGEMTKTVAPGGLNAMMRKSVTSEMLTPTRFFEKGFRFLKGCSVALRVCLRGHQVVSLNRYEQQYSM